VRRLPAILVVAAIALWLPGCSLFKKSTGGGGGAADPPNQLPPPKFPTADPKSDPLNGQSRNSTGNGMLAGRVLDGNSKPPAETSLLFVRADAKDDSAGQETKVDRNGYFTIEKLDRGGKYKLIARGKEGDRTVAGTYYATATNVHVVIQMDEKYVASTTPAIQQPYSTLNDDKKFEPLSPQQPAKEVPSSAWQPSEGVKVAGAELPAPPKQDPSSDFKQSGSYVIPQPLEIPQPRHEINLPTKASVPAIAKNAPDNLGPARVPSSVIIGNKIDNFALADAFNSEPWEFKSNHKGKLVLLDFWGTSCEPCLRTIPTLKKLQTEFGSQGLEVVGIAYEKGGTAIEQGERINKVCQRLRVNYRQLLGTSDHGDIRAQLGVELIPTLILVDENGNLLWRHTGEPSDAKREELRSLIVRRLIGGTRN